MTVMTIYSSDDEFGCVNISTTQLLLLQIAAHSPPDGVNKLSALRPFGNISDHYTK